MSSPPKSSSVELTPAQRTAVIEELNWLLADPLFKSSKRCVVLLSHLVEHALRGDHERCKERILGVEVFGRDANYDSNADPIVRMTANEIRKRLAQCYQEENCSHVVKIHLERGTYFPQFDFNGSDHSDFDNPGDSEGPPARPALFRAKVSRLRRTRVFAHLAIERRWFLWIGIAIVLFAAGLAVYHFNFSRSAQYSFWEPLLDSNQPLTVCIVDDPSLMGMRDEDQAKMIADIIASRKPPLAVRPSNELGTNYFLEASVANRITNWLAAHGRQASLRGSSRVTLQDFRQGPMILVGGFDNAWSLILLSDLRYSIRMDPATGATWIEDAQNPLKHEWGINTGFHFTDTYVDYAVITRFLDRQSGNWIIAVTSLGPHGTRAAAQLITEDSLAKSLPAGIHSKTNIQMVLKTTVLNGSISPPQVLTLYTW
jgi:hypothetical protein